ncbi:hypothetical protein ICW40_13760 [Actinotalea ferrariae]|uniref:DUF6541 family protein n=1 Tax=Actinotalea ferrariae TaxID=1386098 RepID=UPI001C8CC59D|nr:DUF6541 family protein [Actinotalea ferrariae]MBX9245869.1 hypothetical protein [Actinotalea ferrariae]
MAAGTSALVVAMFWLPGVLVLRCAGARGLVLVAAAPLATLGTAGIGAVVAHLLGIPWGRPAAVLAVALAAAGALVLRLPRRPGGDRSTARAPHHGPSRALAAAVISGTALQVVPVAWGMGRPGRLLDAYDVVVHMNTVRHVQESGTGSSLVLTDAGEAGRTLGFYPAAWHDLTALVPVWPDVPTVFNAAVVLPVALAWTAGVALLTRVVLPQRPRAAVWAALLSAAGLALPLTLTGQEAGLVPNATGLSLLPAAVAVVATRAPLGPRWFLTSALVGLSLALVHPNAALAALLVLLPWFGARAVRAVAAARGRTRLVMITGLALGAATMAVALVIVAQSEPMDRVRAFHGDSPHLWSTTVVALLSGKMGTAPGGGGALVVLAALVGAVLVRRLREARWLVVSAALVALFFVGGRSGIPVLADLDVPWYGETKRLAPVLAAVLVPLAALAVDAVGSWLVASGRLRTQLAPRRAALLVGALLVVPGLVSGALDTASAARGDYGAGGRDGREVPTFASDDELAMLHRLDGRLDAGAVLGSPHSGAAHLYALHGTAVTVRSPLSLVPSAVQDVERRLPQLGRDAGLCADLERLGIGYLYVDPVVFRHERSELPLLVAAPPEGVRVVDTGGTAAVYEITACG